MKLYSKAGQAPHFQSIIVDEETGKTEAVVYDDKDGSKGALLASAPALLAALVAVTERLIEYRKTGHMTGLEKSLSDAVSEIAAANQA